MGATVRKLDWDPLNSHLLKGEAMAKTSGEGVRRKARSKVRVRIVGNSSIGWLEVLESWGGSIEAMVVDIPDPYKDTRQLLNPMPTITPDRALILRPLGPWDGCLFANLSSARDSNLVTMLLK